MMTQKILLLWLLIASSACHAQEEKFKAERMASRFVIEHPKVFSKSASASCALSQSWQTDRYAVFNVETGGWVVVARGESDDRILAYSGSGKLNRESLSESMQAWLDHYSSQVSMAGSRSVVAHRQPVAPLITSEWGQQSPYNLLTPVVSNIFNPDDIPEPAYTGCVTTAIAQIMRYHQWPKDSCVVAFKDGKSFFEWDMMLDSYEPNDSSAHAWAVANLMYDVGKTIGSNYSWRDTGAHDIEAIARIIAYYGYSPMAMLHNRFHYSELEWEELFYRELQERRPIFLATGNHAYVCDGCDEEGFFHLNWGWNGVGNGYYSLSNQKVEHNGKTHDYGSGFHAFTNIRMRMPEEDSLLNVVTCLEMYTYDSIWTREEESGQFPPYRIFVGYSHYTFQPKKPVVALGLYRDTERLDIVMDCEDRTWRWTNNFFRMIRIPSNLPDGTYQLKLLWRHNSQEEWLPAQYADEHSFMLSIKGNVMWVGSMENMPASVKDIPICKLPQDAIYDLHGRRLLQQPARGVYIENGRKKLGR